MFGTFRSAYLALLVFPLLLSSGHAADLRVIVGFHGEPEPAVFAQVGGAPFLELGRLGAVAGKVPAGKIRALRQLPGVAYVEEDLVREAVAEPNDTYYDYTFSKRYENRGYNDQREDFALINAQSAWDSTDGSGVTVAVLDTGMDLDHPDLPAQVLAKDFTGSGSADDADGHGSHVSGTVAATTGNGKGVAGTAGGAALIIGKVLGPQGGYDSWVANGMLWAADHGASIVNMSLGGEGASQALSDAAQTLWNAGVLSVAAAGNAGTDGSNHYPSADPNVMAVAAVDEGAAWASFSNYGPTLDVAAPGVSVLSTFNGGNYGWASGTSMASPHVAGVAALVLSQHPTMSVSQLRSQLSNSSLNVVAPDGAAVPILDAAAALVLSNPSPTVLINTPSPGAVVFGLVGITAIADSPAGTVVQVEFSVDDTSVGSDEDGTDGYSFDWDSTTVEDGEHLLSAKVTDSKGETGSDTISLYVDNVDDPPQVSVTYPFSGSTISGNATLAADATDDSAISAVEFYINGLSVGSDSSAPYAIQWDSTKQEDGEYTVVAKATDDRSQATESSPVNFNVSNSVSPSEVTVTSITPNTLASGSSQEVTILGSGFASGAAVAAENGSGPQPEFTNVSVSGTSTITAIVSAKAGGPPRTRTWDVRVSSGGASAVLPGGLTVTP